MDREVVAGLAHVQVLAHHRRGVDGLVAVALDDERHDHDRVGGGLRGLGGGRVQPHRLDVLEALALHAVDGRRELGRVPRPVVEDHRERLARELEIVAEGIGDELGARALGLEAASRQVLGLATRERHRHDDDDEPENEDLATPAGDEALEPVHGSLHRALLTARDNGCNLVGSADRTRF
jgi:hypothetical protein